MACGGNSWASAWLLLLGMVAGAAAMFISLHDLSILLSMLLFASLMAVGFGLRGATPLARRLERVRQGTVRLAGGELRTEVPDDGQEDEIAGLERAWRDLIAAVSHDLRTPLAATLALIEAEVQPRASRRESALAAASRAAGDYSEVRSSGGAEVLLRRGS